MSSHFIGRRAPRAARRQQRALHLEQLEARQLLAADMLFRVNAGGGALPGDPAWTSDAGMTNSGAAQSSTFSTTRSIDVSHASLPAGTPAAMFRTERWDSPRGDAMRFDFALEPGSYEVRLYFAEIYSGALGVGKRVFDVAIEGQTVLDNYDVFADVGGYTGVMKSFVVESDSNLDIDFGHVTQNPAVKGIEVVRINSDGGNAIRAHEGRVTVDVDAGGTLDSSSSAENGAFTIVNNSPSGQQIASVRIDLGTAVLPDLVFDPTGTAGDAVGLDMTPVSGAAVTGQSGHTFAQPWHHGFQALEIAFDDFDPGEEFRFAADIDPSSIRGSADFGPAGAGHVAGIELVGSTITVTFDDGSTLTSQLFSKPGSETGGRSLLTAGELPAPTLRLLAIPNTPAATDQAEQMVRIAGPAGSNVRLLHAEGGLFLAGVPGGGFDVDPFETNKLLTVHEQSVVIGAAGYVDVPVTLVNTQDAGGLNHLVAVITDAEGRTSDAARLVVEYAPPIPVNNPPVLTPIDIPVLTAGDVQTFLVEASDPSGDDLSLSVANLPAFASFTDLGNGRGWLTFTPQAGDVGTVAFTVTATDNGAPPLSSSQQVILEVEEEIVVNPKIDPIVHRVNAGGPRLSGAPEWATDGDFTNAGAAGSKTFAVTRGIDMSHASLPSGTPEALFKTERWDPSSGQEMQWDFDVVPGNYEVRLYFAEIYSGAQGVGQRVFDVFIEGQLVLDNYDVFADVGGYTGVMKAFQVTSDGSLDVDFGHVRQNPAVKGIEIVSLFFEEVVDPTEGLDPNGIFPFGQQIAFGLYSVVGQNDFDPTKSNMQRVAEQGFTLAGPFYHRNWQDFRFIYEAAAEGLQYTYQIREHPELVGVSLNDRPAAIAGLSDAQIADHVRLQLETIMDDPVANATVARWSLMPEELRFWKAEEMRYLRVVRETILQVESERGEVRRPFWMYQANNRTAEQLLLTGEFQDVIARGTYLTTRFERGPQRVGWAMWSFDQIVSAARQLEATPQAVFELFEDFTDPRTGTNPLEMSRVIRHDVYLALVRGIDSLNVFSMWEDRPNLTTHNEQFEAYGSVATDLTGQLDLQKVFLFGQEQHDLEVTVVDGDATFQYTHTDGTVMTFPTLNFLNASFGGERYLILVNSTEAPMHVSIDGLPGSYAIDDLFAGTSTAGEARTRMVTLEPLGVTAMRIRQPS